MPCAAFAPEMWAWVGRATIYKQPQTQVEATLLVVWDADQQDVWVLLTDLRPRRQHLVLVHGLREPYGLDHRASGV